MYPGIISTMLGHMKSIKMSGLSRKLSDTIGNLRIEEINAATPFRILLAVNSAISQIPQMISPVAAFAFFTIRALRSGETLDVTRIFVSLSLIILLSAPLFSMLHFVLEINAAFGCFARIEKFLSMDARTDSRIIKGASTESLQTDTSGSKTQLTPGIEDCELQTLERSTHILRPIPEPETNATIIDIQNASFSWSAEGEPVLKEVDLAIEKGQLAMIIGPVASGKSTLLKGLLGEVPIATGQARLLGSRLSWCEQSTWLIVSFPWYLHDDFSRGLTRRRTGRLRTTSLGSQSSNRNSTSA
jgi:ATP-binding cassette, subfamily C (CFTR/MRP), member 1